MVSVSTSRRQAMVLAASLLAVPVLALGIAMGKVISVENGATLSVSIRGEMTSVQVFGLEVPDPNHPHDGVACFGLQSSEFLEPFVANQFVGIEKVAGVEDDAETLTRRVYLPDGRELAAAVIEAGYGSPAAGTSEYAAEYRNARLLHRGLWGSSCLAYFATPEQEESDLAAIAGRASATSGESLSPQAAEAIRELQRRNDEGENIVADRPWLSARSLSTSRRAANGERCCRVCRVGKACGDSCIASWKACEEGPGCACDG